METYTREQLEGMKRPELQKICKAAGIKANMKNVELVEAYLEYQQGLGAPTADVPTVAAAPENNGPVPMEVCEHVVEPVSAPVEVIVVESVAAIEAPAVAEASAVPAPEVARRRTYDLDESAAVICKTPKRTEKSAPIATPVVPAAAPVAVAAGAEMEELKAKVLSEVDQRVGIVAGAPLVANGAKKSKGAVGKFTATPKSKKDWDKIHTQTFDKMESIEDYLLKKRVNGGGGVKKATDKAETSANARKSLAKDPAKVAAVAKAVEAAQHIKAAAKNVGFNATANALRAITPGKPTTAIAKGTFTPRPKTPAGTTDAKSTSKPIVSVARPDDKDRRKSQAVSKIPVARAILRPTAGKSNAPEAPIVPLAKSAKAAPTPARQSPKAAAIDRALEEGHKRRSSGAFEDFKVRRAAAVEAFRRLSAGSMERMRRTGALPRGTIVV